jgi:uncharacterized protein (TIGR04255 family)
LEGPRRSDPGDDPVTFRHPPVTEVVLAVQLAQPAIDLEVLATFATQVRNEFPQREQHPPLPPMREEFDVEATAPGFQIEFMPPPQLPRTWFITADGTQVLQLQGDRIVFNWRKQEDDATYPRYRTLREHFVHHLARLGDVLAAAGAGAVGMNFAEVTYVNQIEVPGTAGHQRYHPDLSRVLRLLNPPDEGRFLPTPEDSNFSTRFRIPTKEEPRGRLYVAATPVVRAPDQKPIYVMNLAARIQLEDASIEDALQALDLGRAWIVRGFKDLTTDEMHQEWELVEEGNS